MPFAENGHYYESILMRADGRTSKGAFGRAVRELPRDEFQRITDQGFGRTLRETVGVLDVPRERILVERAFRDRAFTLRVRAVYGGRCAMTGLRIANGGGWTEAQAAHIQPVAHRGPDSIRNALLLSSTMHSLFDRGFVSVDEEHRIVVARVGIPDSLQRLFVPELKLILPDRPQDRPHPSFLEWHRRNVLKR